jgi:hypothetical protein
VPTRRNKDLAAAAYAASFTLPVSGIAIRLRHPTGIEDMLLMEGAADDFALALALAERVGTSADGSGIAWRELPVSDLDAFFLRLHQALIGDLIRTDIACRAEGCGSRIDISFGIDAYLAHHAPKSPNRGRRAWSVASCADRPDWFALRMRGAGEPILFRLPTIDDQVAVAALADPEAELARRCICAEPLPVAAKHATEAAMAVMAPSLTGALDGRCVECGSAVGIYFDPRRYVMQALRQRAAFIHEDIDRLAQRYHWSEQAILAMPTVRRASYAELARQDRSN